MNWKRHPAFQKHFSDLALGLGKRRILQVTKVGRQLNYLLTREKITSEQASVAFGHVITIANDPSKSVPNTVALRNTLDFLRARVPQKFVGPGWGVFSGMRVRRELASLRTKYYAEAERYIGDKFQRSLNPAQRLLLKDMYMDWVRWRFSVYTKIPSRETAEYFLDYFGDFLEKDPIVMDRHDFNERVGSAFTEFERNLLSHGRVPPRQGPKPIAKR